MNEMDMLKTLGQQLRDPDDKSLDALDRRVAQVVGSAGEPATGPTRDVASGAPGAPRYRWRIGIAGVLATSLAVGAFIALAHPRGPANRDHVAAPHDAAGFLHQAALVASTTDLPVPHPGQFVFTETVSSRPRQVQQPDGTIKTIPGQPIAVQTWLSVDGTRDGLTRSRPQGQTGDWIDQRAIPGCDRNNPAASPSPQLAQNPSTTGGQPPLLPKVGCTPRPAFNPDMPTTPEAMLTWLDDTVQRDHGNAPQPRRSPGDPTDPLASSVVHLAGVLLETTYLTSAQQSALFDALARLPGVTTRAVHDLTAREGVGVGLAGGTMLVFDAKTFAYLGTTDSSMLRHAIVDAAGQQPS